MITTAFSTIASVGLLACSNLVIADYGPPANKQITSTEAIVDALRPDKPGQARVSASDGSEYTAGQVY